MYTLKIRWIRNNEVGDVVDETTLFIQADEVWVHSEVADLSEMKKWPEGSFFNYQIENQQHQPWKARLIKVERNGKEFWYLASLAWLLGPDGKTIERLTT